MSEDRAAGSESRRRRMYLEAALDAAPDAVVMLDTENRVIEWNAAAEDLFGYAAEEVIGRALDPLVAGSDPGGLDEATTLSERVLSGERIAPAEMVRYRKDGTPVYVLLVAAPIVEGGCVVGAVGTYADVTERRRVEEALRERIKELTCLYAVYRDLQGDYSSAQLCQRIAEHLPPSLQFPEIAGASVEIDGEASQSGRYDDSSRRVLQAELQVGGEARGWVRVAYAEDKPFLIPEEQALIDAVAEGLRLWLAREDAAERSRFQARLLASIGQAIIVTEPDGTITYWNRAAEELYGWDADEVLGRNIVGVTPADATREQATEIMAALRAGETWTGQFAMQRRDGSTFSAIVSDTPVHDGDGELVAVIGITTDVTELKRAEQALRESERKYRQLVENINDVIFSLDLDGHLTYISPVVEQVGGYSPGDAVGRHFSEFVHPEDLLGVQESLESTLAGELKPYEYRILTQDGEVRWVRTSSRPLLEQGRVVGLRGVLSDVTERKLMERALERYSESLEEMVEERSRELEQAQQKLLRRQKLATLGQLAGSINHELRGPLGNIKTAAHFLSTVLEEPGEDVEETLQLLKGQVAQAESTVDGLLNFVRTQEPQREPVDVLSVLDDALSRVQVPRDVEVTVEKEGSLSTLPGDREQLRQVFRNLISNAVEAMPDGGDVIIQARSNRDPSCEGPGEILVSVTDTGEGIAERQREKLFEPLFSTKPGGVGLGLALAHMLVEAHGGRIDVETEVGEGSTFTVHLPLAQTERAREGSRGHGSGEAGGDGVAA